MKNATAKCESCGTSFVKNKSTHRFCSKKCYSKIYIEENREQYNSRMRTYNKERRLQTYEILQCPACKNKFQQHHLHQKFCSDKCSRNYWYKANPVIAKKSRRKWNQNARIHLPWHQLLTSARARAKESDIACDLTEAWAVKTWTGYCAVSGLKFILGEPERHPLAPSIDKIDPNKGYVQTNCRFITWAVNAMKGTHSDEYVYKTALAITAQYLPYLLDAPPGRAYCEYLSNILSNKSK